MKYYANPQYLWNEDLLDFDESAARPNLRTIMDKREQWWLDLNS